MPEGLAYILLLAELRDDIKGIRIFMFILLSMAYHNTTGHLGEDMAVAYLTAKDYIVLHKNWRHSHWEIDIIATLKNKLHFIEVKTRRTNTFGFPEEGVTKKDEIPNELCRRIFVSQPQMENNTI